MKRTTADDTILIHKILARDRRALATFYRRYTPRLLAFIRRKVSNPADAEEILQDALFAFLEALRDFQGAARISTFLFSIANHKIIDYYRKKKIKQVLFSQTPHLERLVSPILDPEQQLDATLLKDKIRHTLARILPRYRKLLVYKYIDNYSVADIAAKLAVSLKSAESQLFRARKAFVQVFLSI